MGNRPEKRIVAKYNDKVRDWFFTVSRNVTNLNKTTLSGGYIPNGESSPHGLMSGIVKATIVP
jgi:hypothetical protein